MQALVSQQLPYSSQLQTHLDNCLTCRACEAACPSGVQYGQIIDATRAVVYKQQNCARSSPKTSLTGLALNNSRLLRFYQRSGLRWLADKSRFLKLFGLERLNSLLPKIQPTAPLLSYYEPIQGNEGNIALFTGCVGNVFDGETLLASISLIRYLGYGVYVPNAQVCCGALFLREGDRESAIQKAVINVEIFNRLNIDAIIYTSSACGATLKEYTQLFSLTNAEHGSDKSFAAPLLDINDFINRHSNSNALTFEPLPKKIAIHTPCSQTHVLHRNQSIVELIHKIPEVEVFTLPENEKCCGAAGNYMIKHPNMADSLRDDKIENLKKMEPDYLLTTNIGCAIHIAAGIRKAKLPSRLMHPAVLLKKQLVDRLKT